MRAQTAVDINNLPEPWSSLFPFCKSWLWTAWCQFLTKLRKVNMHSEIASLPIRSYQLHRNSNQICFFALFYLRITCRNYLQQRKPLGGLWRFILAFKESYHHAILEAWKSISKHIRFHGCFFTNSKQESEMYPYTVQQMAWIQKSNISWNTIYNCPPSIAQSSTDQSKEKCLQTRYLTEGE
jgi:hypothetical protein